MDIIVILIILAGILLLYQLFLRRDGDSLDHRGRPKNKGRNN